MSNIAEINCFSKLFILFGLQYFLDKDLKSDSGKDFKSYFAVYFTILVLLVLGLLLVVISPEFTNGADDDKSLKSFIDRIQNIFMECALVLTLFSGLVESFVKTESVKKLIEKVESISTMFNQEFGHPLDYKLFRKTWMRNFFLFFSMFTFSYVTWVISTIVNGDSFSTLLFCLLPYFFFSLIIFKFVFYVGLVNFQLENLSVVSAPAAINETRQEASANIELRKILALRRIYSSIYDCGQYANNIMTVSTLCTLVVLVILLTSTIFRSFIVIIGDLPLSAFFRALYVFVNAAIMLTSIIFHCQKSQNYVSKIEIQLNCYETENLKLDGESIENIKRLRNQLRLQPVRFSACDIYHLDKTFLASTILSIISYIIILIQFNSVK